MIETNPFDTNVPETAVDEADNWQPVLPDDLEESEEGIVFEAVEEDENSDD